MPRNPSKKPESKEDLESSVKEGSKRVKAYARYSGMAIQMGIIILLGAYGGQWLDKRTGAEKPWFTLLGSLLGIAAALYIVLKGLFKQQ